MDPIASGILLGIANTLVVAVGLSFAIPDHDVGPAIAIIGFIPGVIIGALDGAIARGAARNPRWVRVLLLALIPLGFVLVLGNATFGSAANGAAIPTLVAVLILERSSRDKSLVPRAHVA